MKFLPIILREAKMMKAVAWLGVMILIFTSAPIVCAQTGVQLGPEQEPGTTTTNSVQKTKEVDPQGQVVEKEVKTTSSKRDRAVYKYSGIPCKWTGGVGNTGANTNLAKDTGPKVRYTVDRLPAGANPEEALWVTMQDGRMMMVDPQIVHELP
jgi:hypothetical protein